MYQWSSDVSVPYFVFVLLTNTNEYTNPLMLKTRLQKQLLNS